VENGCYDGSYQAFVPPATVARETKINDLRSMTTPVMGTDGRNELTLSGPEISRGPTESVRAWRGYATPLRIYVGVLAATAVAVTAALATSSSITDPWALICLAAVAAVAERGGIRLTDSIEVSVSLAPILVAAVLFGPLAAVLVAASSMLSDIFDRDEAEPVLRWATYTSTRIIAAAVVGAIASAIDGVVASPVGAVALATAAAALTAVALDISFAALTIRIRGKASALEVIAAAGPLSLASVPIYAPVVAVVVVAYETVSPLTLPLFLAPALAAQRLHSMYQNQRALTADLVEANANLEAANMSFATALVATLDARDRYTAGHSTAVAAYARAIARRMGLTENQQRLAHLAGLVHDIGKVGLPSGLLEKRGPLTLAERRRMEAHSQIGERILANVDGYGEIAEIVRHHHERVDGQGYPDGLVGRDIPLISRIIAVADAYDAMTSDRPYRDAMPSRVARLRLAQAVGSQFDTSVVAAFEAILASGPDLDASRLAEAADRSRRAAAS